VSNVVAIDELFDAAGAAAMVELCERFGAYRMYAELEQLDSEIGRGLSQRHDSVVNFIRTGGRLGTNEPRRALAVRTSYFREEYAYGETARIEGIQPFLHHDALVEAARAVHGRAVIEPAIAYANLMVPGQELAVHTDVPEFRGLNRKLVPQWLLVVMHHSGLFDEWRMPIATGIAWFHDCDGGALAYWPDGPFAPPATHPAKFNTAMVLDTDSVFHGVDRIAAVPADDLPPLRPGMVLDPVGARQWTVHYADTEPVARYDWDDLRFSVSWKAYCFRDEAERDAWRAHADDLTLDAVVERLVADLVARGRVEPAVDRDSQLGLLMIDEYVRFPVPSGRVNREAGGLPRPRACS
jgi:hypothetical protein